jgi:hypothetical protein
MSQKNLAQSLSMFAKQEEEKMKTTASPEETVIQNNVFDIKKYVDDKFLEIDNSLRFIMDHLEKKNDICYENAVNGGCEPYISSTTLEYKDNIGGKVCDDYCKNYTYGPKIDKMKYTIKKMDLQEESVKTEYKKNISTAMSGLQIIGIPRKAIKGLESLLKSDMFINKIIEGKKTQSSVKPVKYARLGSLKKKQKKKKKRTTPPNNED